MGRVAFGHARGVVVAFLAASLIGVALAACGSDDSRTSGAASSNGSSGGVPANADPQLKQTYTSFVENQLPGVPYDVLAKAKEEGTVTWYHLNLPDATKALVSEFTKRFPFIKVNEYTQSGGLLFQRFISEERAGSHQVDVLTAAEPAQIEAAHKEGYIKEYKAASESNFNADTFSSGVWYAFARPTLAVYAYNTKVVKPEQAKLLETYEGLWSSELGDVPMNIYTPLQSYGAKLFFYYMRKTFGQEAWTALAAKKPHFADSVVSLSQLESGEAGILVTSEGSALAAHNSGAPVRWTVPKPTLAGYYPEAIAAKAPHPAAAQLLHEFLLSKDGQEIVAKLAEPSARKDVGELRKVKDEPWFTPVDKREFAQIDSNAFFSGATSLVNEWRQSFQG
jgi:iron(III) transport system substrate-binding protein